MKKCPKSMLKSRRSSKSSKKRLGTSRVCTVQSDLGNLREFECAHVIRLRVVEVSGGLSFGRAICCMDAAVLRSQCEM